MQIATWNVNSLSVRLPQVLDWLARQPVDVLCLQELKLTEDKFPFMELRAAGYKAVAFGQKTYNGVALLARTPPTAVVRNIPGFEDDQARVIAATVETPEDRDSYDPVGLANTIHHTREERTHFQALLGLGLTDAYRMFEQPEKSYSWWDYRMLGFQKNRGLRIDHILVSEALRGAVTACTIDRAPRKNPQPSDHAPVVLTLA